MAICAFVDLPVDNNRVDATDGGRTRIGYMGIWNSGHKVFPPTLLKERPCVGGLSSAVNLPAIQVDLFQMKFSSDANGGW